MRIEDLMDPGELARNILDGFVNVQTHPKYPLCIYNYSAATQFTQNWNDVTKQCRGLIVDTTTSEVVARPFPKFFNMAEHDSSDVMFSKSFKVYDKVDGSLAILVESYDEPFIATRGSFQSEQALWATEHYLKHYKTCGSPRFGDNVTALFEIIYPENRIIVDYGDREDLVLLAVVDNETGQDRDELLPHWPGPVVETFDPADLHPRDLMGKFGRDNAEGIVLRFDYNGHTRVKVKQEDYVELHRAKYAASLKKLEAAWFEGKEDDYIAGLPDEIHGEFIEHRDRLDAAEARLYNECDESLRYVTQWSTEDMDRKMIAQLAKDTKHPWFVFASLDNYDINMREHTLKLFKKGLL